MKLKDLLSLARALGENRSSTDTAFWDVGKKYFIRTVTHHHAGTLVAIGPQEIVLKDAAWIADDGRLTDALKSGEYNEVELFPRGNVLIGRGSIIDAVAVSSVPESQK